MVERVKSSGMDGAASSPLAAYMALIAAQEMPEESHPPLSDSKFLAPVADNGLEGSKTEREPTQYRGGDFGVPPNVLAYLRRLEQAQPEDFERVKSQAPEGVTFAGGSVVFSALDGSRRAVGGLFSTRIVPHFVSNAEGLPSNQSDPLKIPGVDPIFVPDGSYTILASSRFSVVSAYDSARDPNSKRHQLQERFEVEAPFFWEYDKVVWMRLYNAVVKGYGFTVDNVTNSMLQLAMRGVARERQKVVVNRVCEALIGPGELESTAKKIGELGRLECSLPAGRMRDLRFDIGKSAAFYPQRVDANLMRAAWAERVLGEASMRVADTLTSEYRSQFPDAHPRARVRGVSRVANCGRSSSKAVFRFSTTL